jgi:hypothetical protein
MFDFFRDSFVKNDDDEGCIHNHHQHHRQGDTPPSSMIRSIKAGGDDNSRNNGVNNTCDSNSSTFQATTTTTTTTTTTNRPSSMKGTGGRSSFFGTSTNLMPSNYGIAQQRTLLDEVERTTNDANDEQIDLLTKELDSMSMQEKERAMNDLHGTHCHNVGDDDDDNNYMNNLGLSPTTTTTAASTSVKEDQHTPAQWMGMMDAAIQQARQDPASYPALQLAYNTHYEYVQRQRWKFLRAEDWDVPRAVTRLAAFLELKLELFGLDGLGTEPTLADLPPEDVRLWKTTGFVQLSSERDRTGRVIGWIFGTQQIQIPLDTVVRYTLYILL